MTTPNFTPDFTKTGDVFVSRDGTELTFLCDDNDANNDPPIKLGRKGDHYWLYRNGRVFTHREHRMDIVSQYTPTTAPQGVDVPMGGDFHAFARAQSEWSQATFGTDQQRGPIGPLKHLEKEAREAQENPTDIYEFVDCLFLTLDASRRAGFSSESLLHFAWEKLTINKSRDWPKVTDMNAAVEHVREATPAPAADGAGEVQATTPKWPRYLENQQDRGVKFRRVYDSPDAPGRWVDGFVMHLGRFDEAIITQRVIETDAAGNALTPTEPQQASGTDGPLSEFLVSWRDADQLGSNTPLPPQQASGVERYSACRLHGTTEVVTAADHDRVVAAKDAELAEYAENLADTTHTLQDRVKELAERDATIVELRAEVERLKQWELYAWRVIGNLEDAADGRPVEVEEGKSPHPTIKTIDALRTRAEAAEAKVAELELRLANVDKVAVHACDVRDDSIADLELRLATSTESMYVNMKAANEANAQLAAANERVAELEGESKGWHGVVVECEKILKAVGTAEKPLTSNLPNLIRDRLQNLHRAEAKHQPKERP